ncbi:hypothetical protein [Fibrivirga algicola]|uniref:Uncharacterized protein n=1 Tax=Fibrivirga algicola TaxID=2950420 RepID=A0ABX0QB79_9BACT|nr:hypothetical protein [Fibrivirga algicola]ARK12871.1 hypothetical protein A6C57_22460 [Fibrella sp. ES10-3-2-2]NID09579.1 hypothetical protein [Fibrivirga algicola]
MNRRQLDLLIRTHETQRDQAKAYLDKHYYELEAKDQETEWINRYLTHKRIVEELKQEKADDE